MDTFEKISALAYAAFVVACIALISLILFNLAQPKKFDGYYLYTGGGKYQIWINWDNRMDERAYQTFDGDEAVRVYERLTAQPSPSSD